MNSPSWLSLSLYNFKKCLYNIFPEKVVRPKWIPGSIGVILHNNDSFWSTITIQAIGNCADEACNTKSQCCSNYWTMAIKSDDVRSRKEHYCVYSSKRLTLRSRFLKIPYKQAFYTIHIKLNEHIWTHCLNANKIKYF